MKKFLGFVITFCVLFMLLPIKGRAAQLEVVSRVMRKIDYGSGRNLLQGAA